MTENSIVANVGQVYADGVSLILPGTGAPTNKHYRGNALDNLKAGDRVKVTRIGSSYLVDYKIGVPDGSTSKAAGQNYSNPNLLDNWYFGKPVNQRGETSYSGIVGYGFDRWRTNFSGDTVEKTDNGLKNTVASTSAGWHLHQRLELDGNLDGRKIQASALVTGLRGTGFRLTVSFRNSSGTEITASTRLLQLGMVSFNTVIPDNCASIYFGLYAAADALQTGDFAELSAVKLELGTSQTLAHQENGNWVLNGIPNYTQELIKCQRYFVRMTTVNTGIYGVGVARSATRIVISLFLPCNMRGGTSVSLSDIDIFKFKNGDTTITPVRCYRYTASANMVALGFEVSGASVGTSYVFETNAAGYLDITAEL